jgi:hypothetical protein
MSGQKKVGDKYMREAESHQSKTTMKHISNPNAGEKKAAKDIKPGIKGYRDRIDMLKSAQARGALKKEGKEIAFSGSHQGKTTLKHIKNPDVTQRMAAHDIKPGIKGYRDRIALLKDAGQRKNLKKEDFDLLSDLYDHLDESNQEIFLNQLEEDAEVLLAFAKAMADE